MATTGPSVEDASVSNLRPSATVVLTRDAAGGVEAFLVKRSGRSGFMAGAHVFPGGRVEAADASDEIARHTRAAPADQPWALSARVAACRELLEEAGVLLGPDPTKGPGVRKRLAEGASFAAALAAEETAIELDRLTYFAHWVTPSFEPKRYDTRFFLAEAPEGSEASVDRHEVVEGEWLGPAKAIEAHEAGSLFLPPPTLATLATLREFDRVATARTWLGSQPIRTVLPKVRATEKTFEVLFPWDPEYASVEGESVPFEGPLPRGPSRVVIRGF
ncbi:MAG: NUDIX domain-containing protein [Deltaproteobacteria bacterium]|nr:NUDIX domain-containing protein [Deltaproteobacteria bacterium]